MEEDENSEQTEEVYHRDQITSTLIYADDSLRCLQCVFVVMKIFPRILQSILKHSGPTAHSLYTIIYHDKRFKKRLSTDEHNTLQSLTTTDEYSGLDLTLIFKILRNYPNMFIDPPTRGWSLFPTHSDIAIGDDMKRLQLLRNRFFHKVDAKEDDVGYNDFFNEVEKICERIDNYLNRSAENSFKTQIENCRFSTLATADAERLQREYNRQRGVKKYCSVITRGEQELTVYTTLSYDEFIKQIRSDTTEMCIGRITLTFEGNNIGQFVELLEASKETMNEKPTEVKIEQFHEGSLIIELTVLDLSVISSGNLKSVITSVLERLQIVIDIKELLTRTNILVVSAEDDYFPSDFLTDKMDEEESDRTLRLDLEIEHDIMQSDKALCENIMGLRNQIVSKINETCSIGRPQLAILEKTPKDKTWPEEDVKTLRVIYDKVEKVLKCEDFDRDLRNEVLKTHPNYFERLKSTRRDLFSNNCGILVTGETRAGRTTLMNLFVGQKNLFRSSNLSSTANIIRVRNADMFYVKVYTKDEVLMREERFTDRTGLMAAIENLNDFSRISGNMGDIHIVDVYIPAPLLKGNTLIVHNPGFGENDEVDKMLQNCIEHTMSLIFIMNANNADEIRDGMIGRLVYFIKYRLKMRWFDVRNSIFLTNKWDLIPEESGITKTWVLEWNNPDVDAYTDTDIVWKKMHNTLTDIIRGLPSENIFQISLRQVQKGKETKLTNEFERFERKLKQTVEMSQHKRVKFYWQSIQMLQKHALSGTRDRMELLEQSHKQKELIGKNQEKIKKLEIDCAERRETMKQLRSTIIDELATSLHGYLNSKKGSTEIINPEGERDIGQFWLSEVSVEVKRRIDKGIRHWSDKEEAKEIMKVANINKDIVATRKNYIENELKRFNAQNTANFPGAVLTIGIIVAVILAPISILLLFVIGIIIVAVKLAPISIPSAFVMGDFVTPLVALWGWFIGPGGIRSRAKDTYFKVISEIDVVQLKEMFEVSYGKEYDKAVSKSFDDIVLKEIESLIANNKMLEEEYQDISEKRNSTLRVMNMLNDIGERVELLKGQCFSI